MSTTPDDDWPNRPRDITGQLHAAGLRVIARPTRGPVELVLADDIVVQIAEALVDPQRIFPADRYATEAALFAAWERGTPVQDQEQKQEQDPAPAPPPPPAAAEATTAPAAGTPETVDPGAADATEPAEGQDHPRRGPGTAWRAAQRRARAALHAAAHHTRAAARAARRAATTLTARRNHR